MRRLILAICFFILAAVGAAWAVNLCAITGAVQLPDGSGCAGCTITANSLVPQTVSSQLINPVIISTTTDASGNLSGFNIAQGLAVQVTISTASGTTGTPFTVIVPFTSTVTFSALAMQSNITGSTTLNNILPPTANVGMAGFTFTGEACPAGNNQPEVESCTIGGTTPAAGIFTSLTGKVTNGVVNPLQYGVVCDGATDNSTAMQTAITAAGQNAGKTGLVEVPPTCNAGAGHQLNFSTTLTIPENVWIVGMAGSCYPTHQCVEMDYTGSGVAISSTSLVGGGIKHLHIKNTGTGTIGIDILGNFQFSVDGVAVDGGFSTTGIKLEDSAAASAIYNSITNTAVQGNAQALLISQHNSGKAVNANFFFNDQFNVSTTGPNVEISGSGSNENVFASLDISSNSTHVVGLQIDAGAGRGTRLDGVTAEQDSTVFSLSTNVSNFTATAVDAGCFDGINCTPITASPSSTWSICWDVLGNTATECDQSPNFVNRLGYAETNLQEPTGMAGVGLLQNLILQSQTLANASWTKVNAGAQTITDNAATAPDGTSTADTVALGATSTNAFVRQSYSLGSSIQNICFTFSEWFKLDSGTSGTPPPYWAVALQDGAAANQNFWNYPLTTSWTRGSVTNCFPSSVSTSVLPYAVDVGSANNGAPQSGVIVDVWGAQLTKSTGPEPYQKTVATALAATAAGVVAGGGLVNGCKWQVSLSGGVGTTSVACLANFTNVAYAVGLATATAAVATPTAVVGNVFCAQTAANSTTIACTSSAAADGRPVFGVGY